jgi:hypothetical protein
VADIDALNQLLNNEAALFEASQRQAGAMRTQELLNQPLSSFNQSNPNLARDASEWVQAQQARERLRASGAIPQRPAPATATAPNPVNRPVNAAPQPPLSTSAPQGIDPMGFLNNAAGAYAGIQAAGFAEQAIQGGIDAVGDRVIPASVRPVYDRIFEEANRARGMYLPTPVAGITDAARALRGMPPLSPIAQFAAPIACSLFGQGCTATTPDGIPFAGDSLPPFFGGQSPGVQYRVSVTTQYETRVFPPSNIGTRTDLVTVTGPVQTAVVEGSPANGGTVRVIAGAGQTHHDCASTLAR